MRVLLVEDDPDLAEALRSALVRNGAVVDVADRIETADAYVSDPVHDVLILDHQLPGGDRARPDPPPARRKKCRSRPGADRTR